VGEFITAYLSEVNKNPLKEDYTFKKINGKPANSASGLLEDYWFGHWIQYGSGDQVNVTITAGYEVKAKKEIEIGEELFMDYNRSMFYLSSVLWQKADHILNNINYVSLYWVESNKK